MGIYIQYILDSHGLIFDPKCGGGVGAGEVVSLSHFMFSKHFMLFPTFLDYFF